MGIVNKEGSLYMATGIDNSGLFTGLNQAEGRIDQFGKYVKDTSDKIGMALTAGFGGAVLKSFASEIVNVRGEMKMLESSFEVLLGGKGVSGFMSEMKQFAVDSPLSMNGVANAAQTLLGFGIAAEKVMPTIKQIGDISMGNEDRFKSLSLAFAQMSATGKLMGQDLLQMINAGFNPLQVISEKTGKSIGELKKDMESGAISSEMVADAFASATKKGGKFYGMTQKQAEGIRGLQAQLEGGLQDAFNEIGKSQEGLIAGGYKVATALVENYRLVGEALTALIATYGVYKAAMVFNTSIDKTVTVMRYEAEIAELTKLLPLKEQEANADLKTAVASGKLTQAKAEQLIALRAEIQSKLEVIKANQATAVSELEAATSSHKAVLQRSLASKRLVIQRQTELALAASSGNAAQYEAAKKALLEAQEERSYNVRMRKASADTLALTQSRARSAATAVETMQTSINTATQNANTVSTNMLSVAKNRLSLAVGKLTTAMASNPMTLLAASAVALGFVVYKLVTATTIQEKAQIALNKALDDAKKKKDDLSNTTGSLLQVVNDSTKTTFDQISAYKDLQGLYPNLLKNMDIQTFKALSATEQQKLLNAAMSEFDISNQDVQLAKYEQLLDDLTQNIGKGASAFGKYEQEAKKLLGMDGFWDSRLNDEFDVKRVLEQTIVKLKEEQKQRQENLKEAELQAKPEAERRKILEDQLSALKAQESSLTESILKTGEYKRNLDGTISPLSDAEKKFDSISDLLNNWNKNPFAIKNVFESANPVLNDLLMKMRLLNEEKQKLTGQLAAPIVTAVNKATLDEQIKAFKEYEEGLAPDILKKLRGGKSIVTLGLSKERLSELQDIQDKYKKIGDAAKKAKEDVKIYEDPDKVAKRQDKLNNAAETAAEKSRKKLEELSKAKGKQSLQDIRTAKDLEFQMTEARIRAMDEGSAKVIAQMEFDYEKEKEALKRQQEDALKTKKENARDIFEADVKNKGKSFDDSSIKLTDDERKKYADLQVKSDEAYQKDKLTLELQYMRDYIKEYGTFQEKKLTIAQEYDKKIAASANEWDRKLLENQKKAALSSVDFDAINKRIDWQGVFGNLTGMLDSQLKDLISGLKEYIKTDQFKQSSATDQKTVFDAIEKLRSVTPGGEGTLNFKEIQRQMDDLGNAINHLQIATLNEKTAYENLGKAQNEYDKALKSNNQATIEGAKQALAMAQTAANTSSIAYKEAESNVQNLGNGFKETATDTIDGLNLVSDGLNNFASNSLPQIFKGLQSTVTGLSKLNIGGKVGEVIGTLSKTLSNASVVGQIIDAVLSILDVLKDGIGTLVSSLIDTVLGAIDGILKNILSFDITKQIAGSLKTGLSNILNTLSFGGFNSLISSINGGNAKETAKTISRLTSSNEALKVSVDALKDEIAGTNGSKSIQAYNEAVTAQERYSENLRKILDAQMRYSNSHHSNAYYWDLDANSLKEVNKLLGTSLNNTWNDFSKLTADQMNEIRTHLPDVWSEMVNEGKYGDRFKDDWNNYADQAGKVKEMTDDLRENIAQISFDSLRDSFLNTLMDMDSDAEDFADNFEEYLTKALLNFAVGDLLDSRIKKWYESWTDTINEQNGKLTEAQIAQQKKEWEDIVKEGIAIRDNITNSTGYTGKNDINGITGVAASITQDSANELNGNFYALRQSVNEVRNINKQTQEYIKVQTGHISDVKEAVSSYKQVFADQLTYIKMTAENTAATASILREIRDKGIDLRR